MSDLAAIFGPEGFDPDKYADPKGQQSGAASYSDAVYELARAMEGAGLMFTGTPRIDTANVVRVHVQGDKRGSKNGWYRFFIHPNGKDIVGKFGSWKDSSITQSWSSRSPESMSPVEREQYTHQLEIIRQEQIAEQKRNQDEAAKKAVKLVSRQPPASEDHPYLVRKGIKPTPGVLQRGEELIIPTINEAGEIRSYERIYPDGKKKGQFLGERNGCFHVIKGSSETVLTCEGYATAVSLHQASRATIYVSFTLGNLFAVTEIAKRQNPGAKIIVCADNDRFTKNSKGEANPGLTEGKKISSKLNVLLTYPDFPDTDTESTDFNDLHRTQGIAVVRQALGLTDRAPVFEQKEKEEAAIPGSLLDPPGILGDIARYYNATARIPQPGFAVQTALAILSVLLGRRYRTTQRNYSTLYFLNIAKSATGKEHCKTVIEEVLEACGMGYLVAGGGYTSAGAVFSTLINKPCHIAVIDEMGKYLEASKAAANVNAREANRIIMEAIGRCHSILRPVEYSQMTLSDKRKELTADRRVNKPSAVIVGLTTPSTFYENVNREQIKDGFLGRFIVHHSTIGRQIGINPDYFEVPESIIEWATAINQRYNNRGDLLEATSTNSQMDTDEIVIGFTHHAADLLSMFDEECVRLMDTLEKEGIEALAGRTREFAMRMSLICALAADPETSEIDATDAEWAIDYMRFHLNQTVASVRENMVSTQFEGSRNEILEAIRLAGPRGVTGRDMRRLDPFRGYKPSEREEILLELQEGGLIDSRNTNEGKPGRGRLAWVAIDPGFDDE